MRSSLEPVRPIYVADRFPALGRDLVALLKSLEPVAWHAPTVCPAWSVRDVAAHLLDTALRRLAFGRDRLPLVAPDEPIDSYAGLVAFLNRLNADWVRAFRRVSPEALVDLLATVEPQLAAYFSTLDPWAPALGVAWAGEDTSEQWFDLARELTERWHHQQQIRLAVGAPSLNDPFYVAPVLDTFLRALPHRYRETEAPAGTAIGFRFSGREEYLFTLRRGGEGWELLYGREPEGESASVAMADETGWLLLTKGLAGPKARDRSQVAGDSRWLDPFFDTLAVMA
jgi:uncharacterized protein (TIGR03083 family)